MSRKAIVFGAAPFVCLGIFFCFVYLFSDSYMNNLYSIEVREGRAVLPTNSESKLFSLSGLFYFTPNQFYSLMDISKNSYGKIPGSFKDTSLNSRFGYGSYGLVISGLDPGKIYALHVHRFLSSCSIIINSKELQQQGQPGIDKSTEIPGLTSIQVPFRPKTDGSAEIIINVSNFTNRRAGFNSALVLGEAEQIEKMFRSELILNAGITASIFTIAAFFFLLPFFYKTFSFVWWFACAAVVSAIRGAFFYPHIGAFLFPSLDWHSHFIFKYATFPVLVLFFTVFMKRALNICFKIPYTIIITVTLGYFLSTIILPPKFSGGILVYYQIFSIGCILYALIISAIGLIKKVESSVWIFSAVMLLIFFGLYDLCVIFGFFSSNLIMHIGSFVSILILSVMILAQYANSVRQLEKLQNEMQETNKSLVRFFPEKIIELLNKKSITDIKLGDSTEFQMPIFSIDIRSFTHISEQLSTDQVFNLLNTYFALIVPIIRKYNGIITKYLGDGFFALFPEGPDAAVSCAIEIQNKLETEKIVPHNCSPIKVGIGIDFDDILLGIIGDKTRMDSIIISNAYYASEILQKQTKEHNSPIIISAKAFANLKNYAAYDINPVQKSKSGFGQTNVYFEVCTENDLA